MDPGLYRAAKEGTIVVLEQYVDQLEAEVTPNKNTVLHIAAQFGNSQCVREILSKNSSLFNRQNAKGNTALFMLQQGRDTRTYGVRYLETCRAPAYGGPAGRTALHAAVISNNEGGTKTLLDWKKDLAKEPDVHGWTPLHYAARFGQVQRAKQLLDSDKSIAYLIADQDDNKTALHVAASQGHVSVIQELISQCPDCWEMVNHKGQNIFHVAVENEKKMVIKFILKNYSLSGLIHQKDVDGNTPLHLIATEELEAAGATLGLRNVIGKDNEVLANEKKERAKFKKSIPIDVRKAGDTHLIVAILIATVTFAAGFTMPGGYNSNDGPNQGMAILTREAAFKAFVIIDYMAMILSTCAILVYFASADYGDQTKLLYRYSLVAGLLQIATRAMVFVGDRRHTRKHNQAITQEF
ncbi:protein ACCELERATED CELL DEATH 6-like [Camellia sinensis]|uniref:protein ACCELERATED CELL DEATH 6-like n=1 Tax=Camellia sinensis TaxID=4442 RepID=UPI0010366B63|nr:protein ACCELERATED CELL DEATH 6-like [Camellia sinensis]